LFPVLGGTTATFNSFQAPGHKYSGPALGTSPGYVDQQASMSPAEAFNSAEINTEFVRKALGDQVQRSADTPKLSQLHPDPSISCEPLSDGEGEFDVEYTPFGETLIVSTHRSLVNLPRLTRRAQVSSSLS
jgi:hypothetical protein